MDFAEVLKTWSTMSVRKMLITGVFVIVVGVGFLFDRMSTRIEWVTEITPNSEFLNSHLKSSQFEYVGVFEYNYTVPFTVKEIQKACINNTEICYKSKDYFMYQDLSRTKFHMQNLCEVYRFPEGDPTYKMKVIGTCPIIINNRLKGYVLAASMLNADRDDMIMFLRTATDKIAQN